MYGSPSFVLTCIFKSRTLILQRVKVVVYPPEPLIAEFVVLRIKMHQIASFYKLEPRDSAVELGF